MTVHKSQGSEFHHVALVLPDQQIPILTKEILYTALTRSRKSVTIIGKKDMFMKGIASSVRRFSGVAERMADKI